MLVSCMPCLVASVLNRPEVEHVKRHFLRLRHILIVIQKKGGRVEIQVYWKDSVKSMSTVAMHHGHTGPWKSNAAPQGSTQQYRHTQNKYMEGAVYLGVKVEPVNWSNRANQGDGDCKSRPAK